MRRRNAAASHAVRKGRRSATARIIVLETEPARATLSLKHPLLWLVGFVLFAIAGCSFSASRDPDLAYLGNSHDQGFRSEQVTSNGLQELQDILATGSLPELNLPDFGPYRGELQEFYASANGALVWLRGGNPTPQALAMIQLLKSADYKGLDPEDYDASRWDGRVAALAQSERTSDLELARFDVALTISAMRYVSDLQIGRVNPRTVHFAFGVEQGQIGLPEFVRREIAAGRDVNAAVAAVEPPFPTYHRTVQALGKYLELARKDDGELLPVPPKPVQPGDPYAGLPRLARLLTLLGDLPVAQQGISQETYQEPLVEAVKHFQLRHGLEPDGRLGTETLKELNTPLSRRVQQLRLTLERWRWVPRTFERPPVVVNIPEFRVRADDENYHWALSMKVVVGKAYGHETPVFSSAIDSVIFRPYWDVPSSITRAELLPKIKKIPGYLAKNSYEIVDHKGEVLSEQAIGPEVEQKLRSGELRIRQRPGPDNSLGLVKFDFPNPYSVYMHGTPAMELFSRSRRDFSHGCIRVEDPVALAAWILKDKPEWTVERIKQAMDGDQTIRVTVAHPIPVLIVYGTAVVMEDGEVRFFNDIYGGDVALDQALANRHSSANEPNVPSKQRD